MKAEEIIKLLNLNEDRFDDICTEEFSELYANGEITVNIIPNLESTKALVKDLIIAESTKWLVVDNMTDEIYNKLDSAGFFPYENDNSDIDYFRYLEKSK